MYMYDKNMKIHEQYHFNTYMYLFTRLHCFVSSSLSSLLKICTFKKCIRDFMSTRFLEPSQFEPSQFGNVNIFFLPFVPLSKILLCLTTSFKKHPFILQRRKLQLKKSLCYFIYLHIKTQLMPLKSQKLKIT